MKNHDIKDLERIVDPEDFSWVKVKNYFEIKGYEFDTQLDRQHYDGLLDHHKKETEFLINKCRELAEELRSYKSYYEV
jgi:hypothetical protein